MPSGRTTQPTQPAARTTTPPAAARTATTTSAAGARPRRAGWKTNANGTTYATMPSRIPVQPAFQKSARAMAAAV